MSLEKSMELLAESNTKLAEAQSALAEAQQAVAGKYDEMIAFFAANKAAKEEEPEKKAAKEEEPEKKAAPAKKAAKRGRPKKEEKPAEDDGFGEEEETEEQDDLTFDQVKKQLLAVRDAYGGDKAPAVKLIRDHGYKAIPEIQEKDYRAIYDAAQKLIDEAE